LCKEAKNERETTQVIMNLFLHLLLLHQMLCCLCAVDLLFQKAGWKKKREEEQEEEEAEDEHEKGREKERRNAKSLKSLMA